MNLRIEKSTPSVLPLPVIHTSSLADAQVLASFTSSQVKTGTLSTSLECSRTVLEHSRTNGKTLEHFLNLQNKSGKFKSPFLNSQEWRKNKHTKPSVLGFWVEILSLREELDFLSLKLGRRLSSLSTEWTWRFCLTKLCLRRLAPYMCAYIASHS